MKTVRRLLLRDIAASVAFVAVAFLALFFFIDCVDELDSANRGRHALARVVAVALLEVPGHLYELLPIAVLIGTIYTLARMAQTSEFTILRTGGLGPGRALALLATLGAAFAALTFVVGDWVAPPAERAGVALRASADGGLRVGASGAWLRERRADAQGEHQVSVNVASVDADGTLQDVRIFDFDGDGRLVTRVQARRARAGDDGLWHLVDAGVTRWPRAADDAPVVVETRHAALDWPSSLGRAVVAAAVLPDATLTTAELWRYSRHLSDQEQSAQRHEIRFWKRALYPLACVVMVALALPFAYLHARAGGVSLRVFGGILLGISFVLLNNLSGHVGLLNDWTPWIVAAMPSLVYLALSMLAFVWLVRYR